MLRRSLSVWVKEKTEFISHRRTVILIARTVVQFAKSVVQSAKSGVERYLSPVSGKRTTIVLPSFSGRFAISTAA